MKDVYSGADVVVAATCAPDVRAGIFRPREVQESIWLSWGPQIEAEATGNENVTSTRSASRHGSNKERTLESTNLHVCIRRPRPYDINRVTSMERSRWAGRGWTMQEDFLATRLLVFTEDDVAWECLAHAENGDGTHRILQNVDKDESQGRDSRDFMSRYWKRAMAAAAVSKADATRISLSVPEGTWNGLQSMWATTMAEYSNRRLTKLSDRLPALSGLAAVVHQLTGDEYCAGLWRRHLLPSLLWQYQPVRGDRAKMAETLSISFDELADRLYKDYLTKALLETGHGPSWSWVSLEGSLQANAQHPCPQFDPPVETMTRVLDVQVDLVAAHDLFGQVRGGRLTIEAASVTWAGDGRSCEREDVDDNENGTNLPVSNIQKHVARLLRQPDHELTAEYLLRHRPHKGQVTAVLLIDGNRVECRAIIVESIADLDAAKMALGGSGEAGARLYRRVGRFVIHRREVYDTAQYADDSSGISRTEDAAYEDCVNGLPLRKFNVV